MPTPLLLIQNAGAIDGTTYDDPSVVDDGKLAAFDDAAAAKALNAAISGKYQLVEGGDTPIRTLLIDASEATVVKKAYVAPVKNKFVFSSIPVGPTDGADYVVKVIDETQGFEPYKRFTAEVAVAEAQTAAETISDLADALNDLGERTYVAYSNKVDTITVASKGTPVDGEADGATITVEGDDYSVPWDTDAATTASAFVTANKSAFDSKYGITLTSDGADIVLTASEGSFGTVSVTDATTNGADLTLANTQAATTLTIEALEFGTFFAIAKDFPDSVTAPTVTETNYAEGSGTPDQLKEIEEKSFALHGDIYREVPQPLTPESRVEDDGQYLLYHITLPGDNYDAINPGVYPYIVIAIESDTVTGDLDTFFGL